MSNMSGSYKKQELLILCESMASPMVFWWCPSCSSRYHVQRITIPKSPTVVSLNKQIILAVTTQNVIQ